MPRKYVAYGSNLNVTQMRYRCPESTVYTSGVIKDYQLLFKGSFSSNYLTIEPKEGSEVPVVIWEVSEQDELNLDRYEGFPRFYRKETIPVSTAGGIIVEDAFVYIMNSHTPGAPMDSYYETCVAGYRRFGFDLRPLVQALIDSGVKFDRGYYGFHEHSSRYYVKAAGIDFEHFIFDGYTIARNTETDEWRILEKGFIRAELDVRKAIAREFGLPTFRKNKP